MFKRSFDIAVAAVLLLLSSPLLVGVAVAIALSDRGPVFYRGLRIGRSGRPFRIYKFRTMVLNAESLGGPSTSDDDSRITRVGKFLRKYKLDEFPQLINVIDGSMSLVGPRPEVESEVALYSNEERQLLTLRPGITDYASLRFHNEGEILKGSTDPHEAYRILIRPEKIRLGLQYARHRSFMIDLRILAATLRTLIRSRALDR
jgi:lipopolysaccharide/colanic/teichoic acid biosynthesis glycosyltransferase